MHIRLAAFAAVIALASGCGGPWGPTEYVTLRVNAFSGVPLIPPVHSFHVTVTSHAGATGATMDPNNFRLTMWSATYLPRIPSPPGSGDCTASMSVPTNGSATCWVSFEVTGLAWPLSGVLEYRNPSPAYTATATFNFPP